MVADHHGASGPTGPDDAAFEALMRNARSASAPSDALMARVLADAERVQQGFAPQAVALSPAQPGGGGLFGAILSSVGGWPGLSGVTAAGVAGLVLGFYAPDLIDTWSGGQMSFLTGEFGVVPEIGSLWAEAGDV